MPLRQWAVVCLAWPIFVSQALVGQQSPPRFEYSQVHMGMPVRVVLYAHDAAAAREAAAAAFARIAALDAAMSDYRRESEITAVAALAPAAVPVSGDTVRVVARAIEIAGATGGAFDPTVAPLVAVWRDARTTGRLPAAAALDAARARVGWRGVTCDAARQTVRLSEPGMRLDLGGVAKGYILQAALEVLRRRGAGAALIEAGGDIVAGDAPPGRTGWRIDVPGEASPRILTDIALATSGPSAQFVEIGGVRYSHVIDPRTGWALTSRTTAHVLMRDAMTADALATAATVVGAGGLDRLRARFPDARIDLAEVR